MFRVFAVALGLSNTEIGVILFAGVGFLVMFGLASAKGDYQGFTIYGFEGDGLMEKNALSDIDVWKDQIDEG